METVTFGVIYRHRQSGFVGVATGVSHYAEEVPRVRLDGGHDGQPVSHWVDASAVVLASPAEIEASSLAVEAGE